MDSTSSPRLWFAARVLAPIVLMTVAFATPLVVLAPTAGASLRPATTSTVSLGNDAASVKTSNGASWYLSVGVDGLASPDDVSVGLVRIVGSSYEVHSWSIPMSASDLKWSSSSKSGSLDTSSQTSPLATISLKFKETSDKKGTCTSGSETIYSGSLTGEVKLVTGLSGGGTVGSSSLKFDAYHATPEITVDDGCIVPTGNDCLASTIFAELGPVEVSGGNLTIFNKQYHVIGVSKETDISSPSGTTRYDAAGTPPKTLSWNSSKKQLSVSVASGGIVTGSATVTGGKEKKISYACKYGSTSYKVTTEEFEGAKYASPSSDVVTGHMSIGGNLVGPKSSSDAGTFVTTSKKE